METLRPLNILYDHEHRLTQQDVDMANGYVELIERTRSEKTPQVGDRLIYVDRYGKYYGNALIEKREETGGLISICKEPYIPFVWEEYDGIWLSVSGGAFHHIDPRQLKFVRCTEGAFKDWGNCGACANGAVTFTARVPLWSYSEPDLFTANSRRKPTAAFIFTERQIRTRKTFIRVTASLSVTKPSSGSS